MADKLKNLLLVLLLAVMIVLLVLTFWVSVRGSAAGQQLLQPAEEPGGTVDQTPARVMAQPEVLTVIGRDGLYLTWDALEYEQLYLPQLKDEAAHG